MGFSRPQYWNGYPIPSPRDLPHPGTEPGSPALQVDSLATELSGKPIVMGTKPKQNSKSILGKVLHIQRSWILDFSILCTISMGNKSNSYEGFITMEDGFRAFRED